MAKKRIPKKTAVRGVGDVIEKVTTATGIKKVVDFVSGKDCNCKENQKKANLALPFRFKARCLTEKEYNTWKEFTKIRTLKITSDQIKMICRMFADIFNRQYFEPCLNCSPKPVIDMISKIDVVYNTYK